MSNPYLTGGPQFNPGLRQRFCPPRRRPSQLLVVTEPLWQQLNATFTALLRSFDADAVRSRTALMKTIRDIAANASEVMQLEVRDAPAPHARPQ